LLEEELLIDATPLENFSGSAPHADTTVVDEVDRATTIVPAAAVSTVGDPMEYNNKFMRRNLGTSFTECMCRILATNCTTIHWRIKLIITVEIVDSSSACVFHHIVLVRCFHSSVFKFIFVFLNSNNSMSIHRLLVLRIWNILKTQTITLEVLCCALLHIVTMSLL
jgi:hypothetical protein